MKPPRPEDENSWAWLYRRARAVGLDLRTTSLPQAIELLLGQLANEADHRRRKTLVSLASLLIQMEAAQLRASPARTPEENPTLSQMLSLEQARRYRAALLARQKSHKPSFHQRHPTIAEPPEPAEVRVFDLVRTFEEVLEKVRQVPRSHPGRCPAP
jgi:hypothetical protein